MDNVEAPAKQFMVLPGMSRKHKLHLGHRRRGQASASADDLTIPLLKRLPKTVKNHIVAALGEFFGTFMFLFFAFAATHVANASANAQVQAQAQQSGSNGSASTLASAPQASTLLYISLAFGFSLAVNVWIFFRISGGLFNPAVILAMALIGSISWVRAAVNVVSEILGAMAAAAVVAGLFPGPLNVTTALQTDTSIVRGLFIEMFLTAELVFTICMLAIEKHQGNFLAPIGVGLALFVAELAGVYFTGGSLNPARSFGPAVVTKTWPTYHWIYWVGPILGALLAVAFYRVVKMLEYETATEAADDAAAKKAEARELDSRGTATTSSVHGGPMPPHPADVAINPLGSIVPIDNGPQISQRVGIARTTEDEKINGVNGVNGMGDRYDHAARQV